ncbi:hypothetical protein [Polluticaenibacter yanchengensis]|uniref:DUF4932 domain-containing protein n=1 Tax=Polluticaenibacter yanchengensis TaxID=3014562 RepID=A0ABT4UL27_9BACT|nr:hypothetical protein [Chitinophagaceae bacterium LY-5]
MKSILLLLTAFFQLACNSQNTKQENVLLTISPNVNRNDTTNLAIIQSLNGFLATKNTSLTENRYWINSDFQKYIYPYIDIYNIENSKYGKDFYRPSLVEIISTENPVQKIIKLAFIGHSSETGENQLKLIYNLVANIKPQGIRFSRYLDYSTQHWQTLNKSSLTYKLPPHKTPNENEMISQEKDIQNICTFFHCKPIPITYYSCTSPKEIFEIKGFDYHPMMYAHKTGGLADYGNIIYSGNHSEIYTHEIIHIYTNQLFPKIDKFMDEGIATFMAGSGKFDYEWHRNKLEKFLNEHTAFNFAEHTDAYERLYFEQETSIPYLAAALIMERTLQVYGKEQLIELLKSETDLWTSLKKVGLTKENINEALRKQIKLPVTKPL